VSDSKLETLDSRRVFSVASGFVNSLMVRHPSAEAAVLTRGLIIGHTTDITTRMPASTQEDARGHE
jgi:hypothetical protein